IVIKFNSKNFMSKVINSHIKFYSIIYVLAMTNSKKDYQKILGSVQKPVKGEAGKTGTWSSKKPIIDIEKCIPARSGKPSCFNCWLFCPEAVISRTIPPIIELDYCKGCGICMEECPVKAITMEEVKTN
ncbi:MAG: 4Fe-4S binding protein, partial [Promethearchaeota archaeon]